MNGNRNAPGDARNAPNDGRYAPGDEREGRGAVPDGGRGVVPDGPHVRGVYLWAGNATIDLLRVKFPDRPIDEQAHRDAHGPRGARELAACGLNWAFLSMNWGFPPEREEPHWDEFERAAASYRDHGFRVIGYVQASNCLAEGSYAGRDWYALTPAGRRISYFRRRLMTCWNHPEWIAEVERHARRAVAAGADGVFFDNIWMGATPWTLGGVAGGFAGCACERCREAFHNATGHRIPRSLGGDAASLAYLRWRAGVVAARLGDWGAAVRRARPGAIALANNCDVILRDTVGLFGIDPRAVAEAQDALLVENVAMPRYDSGRRILVANALPLKAVRELSGGRPVLAITYEHGIGLDTVPAARHMRRMIAEIAAVGASPVVKGSEYLDTDGRFSVLTADAFRSTREAIAPMLDWLDRHAALYVDARPRAAVAVLYDEAAMTGAWARVAPATLAVAMSLIAEAVPFRFLSRGALDDGEGHDMAAILVPPGSRPPPMVDAQFVQLPADLLEVAGTVAPLLESPVLRALVDPLMRGLATAYFGSARARRLIDATGLTARFLRSPFFRLVRGRGALRGLLPAEALPVARADMPVLVESWRRADGARLLHLVNYGDEPVRLTLAVDPSGEPTTLHSPDDGRTRWLGGDDGRILELDSYAIVEGPSAVSDGR